MRMIDRFDLYMKYKHINDNQVSVSLGLSNGTIGKSRREGRDLSKRVIELIENYYTDLNGQWLRTGEGDILKPTVVEDSVRLTSELIKIFQDVVNSTIKKDESISQLATMASSQQDTIKMLTEMVRHQYGGSPNKDAAL